MNLDTVFFIAVLFLFILVGVFKNRKVTSEESYLFAKRQCGFWGLSCTLIMTELNTSTLLAFSGLGYVAGRRALFLPFVFLIGLLFYGLTVAKKYKAGTYDLFSRMAFRAKFADSSQCCG